VCCGFDFSLLEYSWLLLRLLRLTSLCIFTEPQHTADLLASGGQGAVYRCYQNDGTQVAVKVFHPTGFRSSAREIAAVSSNNWCDFFQHTISLSFIMNQMTRIGNRHISIVACYGQGTINVSGAASALRGYDVRTWASEDKPTTATVLSLEYAAGGDMLSTVHSAGHHGLGDNDATRTGAAQLASALAFCHAHGVAHRDVKPENILQCGSASAPCWKLADFGAASVSKADPCDSRATSQRIQSSRGIGSAAYAAPEVVAAMDAARTASSTGQTEPCAYEVYGVDVWSFGVTLFVLASGQMPFKRACGSDAAFLGFCAATQAAVLSPRAAQVAPAWAWPAHFSSGLIELLTGCLQVDPSHRATAQDIGMAPWMQERHVGVPVRLALDEDGDIYFGAFGSGTSVDCSTSLLARSGSWAQLPGSGSQAILSSSAPCTSAQDTYGPAALQLPALAQELHVYGVAGSQNAELVLSGSARTHARRSARDFKSGSSTQDAAAFLGVGC